MEHRKPEVDANTVVFAKDQPEYLPVEVALVHDPLYKKGPHSYNTLLIRYKPDMGELRKLMAGESVYLHMLTGGGALQPHKVTVGVEEICRWYGVNEVRES